LEAEKLFKGVIAAENSEKMRKHHKLCEIGDQREEGFVKRIPAMQEKVEQKLNELTTDLNAKLKTKGIDIETFIRNYLNNWKSSMSQPPNFQSLFASTDSKAYKLREEENKKKLKEWMYEHSPEGNNEFLIDSGIEPFEIGFWLALKFQLIDKKILNTVSFNRVYWNSALHNAMYKQDKNPLGQIHADSFKNRGTQFLYDTLNNYKDKICDMLWLQKDVTQDVY
jgi:hypothetical protein